MTCSLKSFNICGEKISLIVDDDSLKANQFVHPFI